MKTTLLYLIITVKTLSVYFLIALGFALLFSSCQPEEVAPALLLPAVQRSPSADTELELATTVKPSASIPPDEVIRTDYPGATQWRITFEDHGYEAWYHSQQRYFSTSTGSFYSSTEIKNSIKARSDFDLFFQWDFVYAPNGEYQHVEEGYDIQDTQLKTVNLNPAELQSIIEHDPDRLERIYEANPAVPIFFAPYGGGNLKAGDTYLFKVNENEPRYGFIEVIQKRGTMPGEAVAFRLVVEVTVQSGSNEIILVN